MYSFTRRIGETLNIGENVKMRILDIRGSQVCIVIDAPDDIEVLREEVFHHIPKELTNNSEVMDQEEKMR